jgi:hypothetical protein
MSIKTVIAIFLMIGGYSLNAQEATTNSAHQPPRFFVGAGITVPFAATLQAGGYSNKGWGAALTCNAGLSPSEHKPSNYDGGNGLFGDGSDDVEPDRHFALGISAFKLFRLKDNIGFSLEVGPSLMWQNQADNFVPVANPCSQDPFLGLTWCSANYTYESVSRFGTGGYFRGAFHLQFLDAMGGSLGMFAHFNQRRTYFGVDLMLTAGIFRKARPD